MSYTVAYNDIASSTDILGCGASNVVDEYVLEVILSDRGIHTWKRGCFQTWVIRSVFVLSTCVVNVTLWRQQG